MKNLFWSLSIFLVSCTSIQKKISGPLDPNRVFPDGTYRHRVTLTQANGKENEFEGILKLKADEIRVIGLSHFGSTVFEIVDHNGKIDLAIYYEPMKKHEGQFKDFYVSMKKILVQKNDQGEITLDNGAKVTVGKKDENQIPDSFEIIHPKFKVRVKVAGYDL